MEYMSEADAMSMNYDDGSYDDSDDREQALQDLKEAYTEQYNINKSARTRVECKCPVCHKRFIKKSYQQAFDRTKCKDRFWNTVDDSRRFRATLFSR